MLDLVILLPAFIKMEYQLILKKGRTKWGVSERSGQGIRSCGCLAFFHCVGAAFHTRWRLLPARRQGFAFASSFVKFSFLKNFKVMSRWTPSFFMRIGYLEWPRVWWKRRASLGFIQAHDNPGSRVQGFRDSWVSMRFVANFVPIAEKASIIRPGPIIWAIIVVKTVSNLTFTPSREIDFLQRRGSTLKKFKGRFTCLDSFSWVEGEDCCCSILRFALNFS